MFLLSKKLNLNFFCLVTRFKLQYRKVQSKRLIEKYTGLRLFDQRSTYHVFYILILCIFIYGIYAVMIYILYSLLLVTYNQSVYQREIIALICNTYYNLIYRHYCWAWCCHTSRGSHFEYSFDDNVLL